MKEIHFQTQALKSVENQLEAVAPISTPLYLSTTFARNPDGTYPDGFIYTRHDNPNRRILEQSLAQLEKGAVAYAFSSGMAAIHTVFQTLKPGDHVLLPDDVYYNIYLLMEAVFKDWGLEVSLVDCADLDAVAQAIQTNTKLIWLETPSNPQLKITDIAGVVALAQTHNILVAVDNTWASPVLQQPLDLGADIVMHSTTKYFGGHSDVLGGALILKTNNELADKIRNIQTLSGAVPSPFDCWLIARGIQTLYLRVQAQSETALALAQFLAAHPQIECVNYPGLASHPKHEVARSQMRNGFGGMLSILVKGDAKRAMQIASCLEYFAMATSLGGVESLVEHRKSVEGENSTTPANLLRLSIGLEHIEDLKKDWEQALSLSE
ncbi:MAG: aminotransferase class I/II-fold pyridoxal phosphate-dependent enzyme [Bacteroidota bacterium]